MLFEYRDHKLSSGSIDSAVVRMSFVDSPMADLTESDPVLAVIRPTMRPIDDMMSVETASLPVEHTEALPVATLDFIKR